MKCNFELSKFQLQGKNKITKKAVSWCVFFLPIIYHSEKEMSKPFKVWPKNKNRRRKRADHTNS